MNSGSITGAGWDVVLTREEIARLASGISPLLIRPDRLVYYAPLVYEKGRRD